MRQRLEQIASTQTPVSVNFAASTGAKLVNINGTITEVGDEYVMLRDIYGNSMLVPFRNIAYFEIKK